MSKNNGSGKRKQKLAIEYRAVADLVPYARNARTHSPEQISQIVASIREFGWTNPVLIDEHGGIIAGHGRVLAAQKLAMPIVPCIVLSHLTEAQKRAYAIADNKLALNAGWDLAMLGGELLDLKSFDFDLTLLGFNEKELLELMPPNGGANPPGMDHTSLAERFGVPPFSVLDARQGYWQERKRAWLSLGIQSEVGRGDAMPSGEHSVYSGSSEWSGYRGPKRAGKTRRTEAPGGSLMPAANYSKTKARGDMRGRAIARK